MIAEKAAARCGKVILLLSLCGVAIAETPLAGLWKTFDDKTGAARGMVRIYEHQGSLEARIESAVDPAEANERCEKCPGERKNQPVLGMVIIRGMTRNGDEYSGGEILDPDTGTVYRCKLRLIEEGKKLLVRGYIGMAVFGRSQVWIRAQ